MRSIEFGDLGKEVCQRLSPIDSLHIALDKPGMPQVIATTVTVDTTTSPVAVTAESWRNHLARRAMQLPFLYRVHEPTFGSRGVWRHTQNLDLDYHFPVFVHNSSIDRSVSSDFLAKRFKEPIDPAKPPWDFPSLISADGSRITVCFRLHHSLVDGIFAFAGLRILFDDSNDVDDIDQPLRVPDSVQRAAALDSAQFTKARRRRWRQAKVEAVGDVPSLLRDVRTARSARSRLLAEEDKELIAPTFGGRTSWGRERPSGGLDVKWGEIESARIRRLRSSLSVGYNEVAMALYTGALKAKLHREGVQPNRPLICGVPVSTRTPQLMTASGNYTGSFNLPLPVHLDDPIERAGFIKRANRLAEAIYHSGDPNIQERLGRFVPTRGVSRFIDIYGKLNLGRLHPQIFDTFATVLPLPSENLHIFGSRVVDVFSTSALNHLSHCELVGVRGRDSLRIAFAADPVTFGDAEEIVSDMVQELSLLERRSRATVGAR